MPVPFLDLKKQYSEIKDEIQAAVMSVVESGRYILGENVARLEEELASYCEGSFGVGVASGTDALFLSLRALDLHPGDEVITSPFTFIATAEAISYCGARPVFVDIDPETLNLDPEKIPAKITPKTRVILPVHLFGLAAEMAPIITLAQKYNLKIVEDACQAIGTTYKGKKAGSLGDAGCFSFFPTKNLGGFGDGGMVITSDEQLATRLRMLRNHGSAAQYHHDFIGHNSRLDEIQAAILKIKLRHLEKWIAIRQEHAAIYQESLKNLPVKCPVSPKNGRHTYHQYTILAKDRDKLREYLAGKGIGTMVYYPIILPQQKVYAGMSSPGEFPAAEKAQKEVLSLPISQEITTEQIKEVCQEISNFYDK